MGIKIICVFVCIIIVCIFLREKIVQRSEHLTKFYEELDVSSLKNFDLIFFSTKGIDDYLIRWWLDIDFSHVCLVVKKDELYVLETDMKHGTRLIRLKDKLNNFSGYKIAGLVKSNGCENFSEDGVEKFIRKHKNFDKLYIPKRILKLRADDCCGIVQSFLEKKGITFTKNMDVRDFINAHKYSDFYDEEIMYFSF